MRTENSHITDIKAQIEGGYDLPHGDAEYLLNLLASRDAEHTAMKNDRDRCVREMERLREANARIARETWEAAEKIADQFAETKPDLSKSDNHSTARAIASIMSETGMKIAKVLRSRANAEEET